VQPPRTTKLGVSYAEQSETESDDEVSGHGIQNGAHGIRLIAISPHSDERIKRAAVLLGQRKSTREDNPDTLAEFTGILDSLMKDGKLPVNAYKRFMRLWKMPGH
jgi:hypothetical protein